MYVTRENFKKKKKGLRLQIFHPQKHDQTRLRLWNGPVGEVLKKNK